MRFFWAVPVALSWVNATGQNPFTARPEGIAPDSAIQRLENVRNDGTIHLHLRPYSPLKDAQLRLKTDSAESQAQLSVGAILSGGYAPSVGPIGAAAPMVTARIQGLQRFYAEGSYVYWLEEMPGHVERFADSTGVIPGIGWRQPVGTLSGAHMAQARIIYSPNKFFEFEAGRGRHFWGDGYRSVLLGDHAAPYPYVRINTRVWRAQLTNVYALMRDVTGVGRYRDSRTKFMSMHALSWNITRNFNFSFYESVVWQSTDTMSVRGFEFNYLNPFVLYRPLEFNQGSADNVLLGASTAWQITKEVRAYAQLMLDEFLLKEIRAQRGWWANKFAVQWGLRWHQLFGLPLHVQTEWSLSRPFTYTHGSPLQGYGHLGQSVAHPLGTNFIEWTTQGTYHLRGCDIGFGFTWASFGRDRDGKNWGGNVLGSYANPARQFFNQIGQGNKHTLHVAHVSVAFRPLTSLKIRPTIATYYRYDKDDFRTEHDFYINLGFNMPLVPHLRDF